MAHHKKVEENCSRKSVSLYLYISYLSPSLSYSLPLSLSHSTTKYGTTQQRIAGNSVLRCWEMNLHHASNQGVGSPLAPRQPCGKKSLESQSRLPHQQHLAMGLTPLIRLTLPLCQSSCSSFYLSRDSSWKTPLKPEASELLIIQPHVSLSIQTSYSAKSAQDDGIVHHFWHMREERNGLLQRGSP